MIGAALVTAAALPHLTERYRRLPHLGQRLDDAAPGRGSVPAVTKAALDKLVEAWRAEHPGVGFTRWSSATVPAAKGTGQSQFATGWDPELAAEVMPTWIERRYMSGTVMEVEEGRADDRHRPRARRQRRRPVGDGAGLRRVIW